MNRTRSRLSSPYRPSTLVVLASAGFLSTGCQLMQNPFVDELSPPAVITTPSAQAAHAEQIERIPSTRSHAAIEVHAKDGSVTHGPLLFEGAYEAATPDDTQFSWSRVDSVAWSYGTGRFLANIALYPISVVATPPWKLMVSDGKPSRSVFAAGAHDSAAVNATVPDTHEGDKTGK